MSALTHAGLFEGYGGTTMAAALALGPLDTRWVSDVKPASVALLAHRHPEVPNLGDMTAIDYTAAPRVAIATASWPCQPHSSAGKRLGEADPRALWPHVARAVAQLRPAVFLGENVARIAGNGELRRVVRALAELGYVGAWRCVRASDVGAPHRRDRCFVVAVDPAADAERVAGRLADGHAAQRGRPDAAEQAGVGNRRAGLTLLKTPTANLASNGGTQHPEKRKAGGHGPTLADEVEWLLPTPSASSYGSNRGGAAGRVGPVRESLDTMARHERIAPDQWRVYAAAVERWERVLGRPAPDPTQPSPKAGAKPVLSPRFVEWMMGLPAGWVTDVPGLTRAQMLSLLGDGVVPQQGAHAFRFLLAHLAERISTERAA